MMINTSKLCSPANVERAKYVQIVVLALAVGLSGYLLISTFSGVRQVWKTQKLLSAARMDSGTLSRKAADMKNEEKTRPQRYDGGVDVFALQLSRWAAEQKIRVEAVTPQGAPAASDITVDNISLGAWNAVKVRVEGQGDYFNVLRLLNRFRDPDMPIKLDAFSFQSASSQGNDDIRFDLQLTVYERRVKSG